MMKQCTIYVCLLMPMLWACNTPKEAPEPTTTITYRIEDLSARWQLVAGSAVVGGIIQVPNIYDRSNPSLAPGWCTENSILDLRNTTNFAETADCYAALGNPQTGTWRFDPSIATFTITFATTALGVKPYKIQNLTASNMIISLETVQNVPGFGTLPVITTFTYNKLP